MKPSATCNLEETRVARVDPVSGRLHREPPNTPDPEHTEICAPNHTDKEESRRKTTEFVPQSGVLATGEVTSAWSTGPTLAQSAGTNLRRAGRAAGKRARLMLLSAVTLAAALVVIVALDSGPQTAVSAEGDPAHEPVVSSHLELSPAPPAVAPSRPADTDTGSLRQAVDALVSGRRDEALTQWKRLELTSPGNRASRVAVQILSREDKGAVR